MIRIYWTYFSAERRQKRKIEHETGLALLYYALQKDYEFSDIPAIAVTAEGKPYLAETDNLYFNITHCKDLAACAIGQVPIGIDAEGIRPFGEALQKKVLGTEEQRELEKLPEDKKKIQFLRYWTLKESYVKAKGCGLRIPPCQITFGLSESREPVCVDLAYTCRQEMPDEGHVLSVIWKGGEQKTVSMPVDARELQFQDG